MPDLTYATRVLLRAISDLPENQPVHADTVREALDAAELTSAERGGAFNAACTYGYLRSIHDHLADGTPVFWCVPSRSEGRKSGHNLLYARTDKPVPEHLCQQVAPSGSDLARLDGCPSCVDNTELPFASYVNLNGATVAFYRCADCGQRWHTTWAAEAA